MVHTLSHSVFLNKNPLLPIALSLTDFFAAGEQALGASLSPKTRCDLSEKTVGSSPNLEVHGFSNATEIARKC